MAGDSTPSSTPASVPGTRRLAEINRPMFGWQTWLYRVYCRCMAKVMVSLPDELLRQVDAEAARRGTTRSGLLRDLADQSLRRRGADRAARVSKIAREAGAHGGDVAAVLRRHRSLG